MNDLPINPTDIAVLAVLLLSALLAFARGLVREVLSVAAWVGAAFAAYFAFPHVQPLARQYLTSEVAANAAAALGVFLLALIVLSILGGRLSRFVRGSALSAVDRSLGFVFGLARGAVLVCLAYLLVVWVFPDPAEHPLWLREARTMPVIQTGAERLRRLVPDGMRSTAERRSDAAAAAARAEATRALEAEALRRMSLPVPPAEGGGRMPTAGYGRSERNNLDRLIETNSAN